MKKRTSNSTSVKNILIGDANFCILPILEFLTQQDYNLSVVGSKLDDPGHLLVENSVKLDYSIIDLLYNHIMEKKYDGIVPGCNDASYIAMAYMAEKFGLPGFDKYETALIIHYKNKFRVFAEQYGYQVPKTFKSIEEVNKDDFPVLIKPVDSFSGKGIFKVNNYKELKLFWKKAKDFSKKGTVISEKFIDGQLYSHSAFIKNKTIVVDFFVKEYCTVYPYQVNSSNVTTDLNLTIQNDLRKWTESFASNLDLCDGLVHTQFIVSNKTYFIVEVTRRCPGDLYSQLIKKSTGVNYAELYSLPFLGKKLPKNIEQKERKFISRHTVSVDKECVFISSDVNLKSKNIQNIQLKYSGQKIKAAPFDKAGIYFIEHENENTMEEITEKLKDLVIIETLNVPLKEEDAKI